jgi:hypothetical protein
MIVNQLFTKSLMSKKLVSGRLIFDYSIYLYNLLSKIVKKAVNTAHFASYMLLLLARIEY